MTLLQWRKRLLILGLCLAACAIANSPVSSAQTNQSGRITLAIENPSKFAREDELIVLPIAEIRKQAPDFDPATFVAIDPGISGARQLPSQADDLDGDGEMDEVCFLISLEPFQTRHVSLVYGPGAPAHASYPKRTQAKFSMKYEGLAWESELIGYRLYFDERSAVDVYGKHDQRLSLGKFAEENYNYHQDTEWGRDVLKVGQSLGAGSLRLWKDGKLITSADVADRSWRLVSDGPVRSIIELRLGGWNAAGKTFVLVERFTAQAGQRWTKVEVTLNGPGSGYALATGIAKHDHTVVLRNEQQGYLGSWGQQVENAASNLGLAVLVPPDRLVQFTEDPINHIALLSLKESSQLTYYLAAAWDAEQKAFTSAAQWKAFLEDAAARLHHPVKVRLAGREYGGDSERVLALSDYEPISMLKVEAHEGIRAKFPAIDFHNHIENDDPERLIKVMDASNVAMVINFTGGFGETLKEQVAKVAAHPDRFLVFANIDWSRIDEPDFGRKAALQLEGGVKAGARGLKIFKNLGLGVKDKTGTFVAVDDPRLDPIWEKAGELGIPVVIHSSDPDAFFLPIDRFNERYEELQAHPDWSFCGPQFPSKEALLKQRNNVIARHPHTTFVGLHMANHPEKLAEVAEWLDRYPNLYVEMGARLNELGREPYTARKFFLKYSDRIMLGVDDRPTEYLYGTYFRFLETFDEYFDYFTSPTQGRWKIYGIGLPDDVLEKVYRGNARKILKLK